MLQYLRIKNFKSWKDTKPIRMAPISLFFGTNSSGKSSLGQFLLMLKQTVESQDRKAVFYPGGKNSPVQLGSYSEMVHQRDPTRDIAFEYAWSLEERLRIEDPLSDLVLEADSLSFAAEAGLTNSMPQSLGVRNLHYVLRSNGETSLESGMKRKDGVKDEYRVHCENFPLKKQKGRAWPLGPPIRFYGFPNETLVYHQNADFVRELNLCHEGLLSSVHYLGPLRTKAERLYPWTGIAPDSVGYSGENTIAAILAARNRKINLARGKTAIPFEQVIASKLKEMGLIEEFSVNAISAHRQEYEIKVRTRDSQDWVGLADVGFGVSQVLPVLVQCFYAAPGSIIIMEQPEIHLHPSAQSALADVMIDVINCREGGADRNIQLIIESHSEHFLRRLQRRIAEERIKNEKVAAFFASTSRSGSHLEPLEIDDHGSIHNWPVNFFGDEMGDITAQAKAAVKRRMGKESIGA